MPIYEYTCRACESDFEKLVKISDPTPPCPECGAGDVKKRVSAAGFVLKGSGWYKDHYGLKSSSSSEKKSETKSEKKAPAESSTASTTNKPTGSTSDG